MFINDAKLEYIYHYFIECFFRNHMALLINTDARFVHVEIPSKTKYKEEWLHPLLIQH